MSAGFDVGAWAPLFGAQAAAAAALAGLIFVAISLNLKQVLAYPSLPPRAGEALVLLMAVLVYSLLALAPQPVQALAVELLLGGAIVYATITMLQVRAFRATPKEYRSGMVKLVALGQVATLFAVAAGVSLLAGAGGGLYWLCLGSIASFVQAVAAGWILLIEIVR